MWLQVHLAKEELEYWLQDGLVLPWGNAAQPEDLKDLVIDVALNVLRKVRPLPSRAPAANHMYIHLLRCTPGKS